MMGDTTLCVCVCARVCVRVCMMMMMLAELLPGVYVAGLRGLRPGMRMAVHEGPKTRRAYGNA